MPRQQILCVMRMPPDINGHGGSQRAWYLLNAIRSLGDIHFVLIYRSIDKDCVETSLEPLKSLTSSITRINIAGWNPSLKRKFGVIPGSISDLFKMRSQEAPRLSLRQLKEVAAQLPIHTPDILFAGRLCSAFILQNLIDANLLSAPLRVVDFDDIMSKYMMRQTRALTTKTRKRIRTFFDAKLIKLAEDRIANSWHGVSVCTDEDMTALQRANPTRIIAKVPNVLSRPRLPPRRQDGVFRILFVGNLGFAPNVDGLALFVKTAFPALRSAVPSATLTIVGMNPSFNVTQLARDHGLELHVNVPTLEPFYTDCDVVIAPILFGSGTRIKILEAMAYGRTVVSTSMGADGMGLIDGEHLLLANDMDSFAKALERLFKDPDLSRSLAQHAYDFQQRWYTPAALDQAVQGLVEQGAVRARQQALPIAPSRR